jgi:hypothetical protein
MPTTSTKRIRPKAQSTAAYGTARSVLRGLGRLAPGVGLTCLILVSLAGLCVVMMPVTVLTSNLNLGPSVIAAYGSLREGRADLAGEYRLDWTTSLHAFHLATPIILTGPDTRFDATLRTGLDGIRLEGANGRAGPGLAQLVPVAWNCDITAHVADVGFVWTWSHASASGEVTTPLGTCRKDGRNIELPPLTLDFGAEGKNAVVSLRTGEASPMADLRIGRDRVIDITIWPEAAEAFLQFPPGGPIRLQMPF